VITVINNCTLSVNLACGLTKLRDQFHHEPSDRTCHSNVESTRPFLNLEWDGMASSQTVNHEKM